MTKKKVEYLCYPQKLKSDDERRIVTRILAGKDGKIIITKH